MTARELIELLETHDTDKPVAIYDDPDKSGVAMIGGIDSYEDALVLVADSEAQ